MPSKPIPKCHCLLHVDCCNAIGLYLFPLGKGFIKLYYIDSMCVRDKTLIPDFLIHLILLELFYVFLLFLHWWKD